MSTSRASEDAALGDATSYVRPTWTPVSPRRLAAERFLANRAAVAGLVLLALVGLLSVVGPMIWRYGPNDVDLSQFRMPPSLAHPLGTDDAGRDVLARLLYGGRVSLSVGLAVALFSTTIGLFAGALAGLGGSLVDGVVMRATEVTLSFPPLVAVAIVAVVAGPSVPTLVLVMSLFSWPTQCRIARAITLAVREKDHVMASRALGARESRILVYHIVPFALSALTVAATVAVAVAVLAEAGLSYLGYGVPPPDASWGNMLNKAQSLTVLETLPWVWLPPGLAIAITVIAINLLGNGLRDALDPHQMASRY